MITKEVNYDRSNIIFSVLFSIMFVTCNVGLYRVAMSDDMKEKARKEKCISECGDEVYSCKFLDDGKVRCRFKYAFYDKETEQKTP